MAEDADHTDRGDYKPLLECHDRLAHARTGQEKREVLRAYYRQERAKAEAAGRGREYADNGHGNNRQNEARGELPRNHPEHGRRR